MKQIFIMIAAFLIVGFQSNAQNNQDQISYGDVRYDGFAHITKGAFWPTRPEAKLVYEGSIPPGVEVYELTQDYFVRFVDAEHNNLDRNYIVFPKGQRIYKKGNYYYAAICGNRIEFLRPVVQTKVINTPTPPTKKDSVIVTITRRDSVITTITRKDSLVTTPKVDDDYEVEEKVVPPPVVNNYYSTTNNYDQPRKGGQRRVYQPEYRERRGGFRIDLRYNGQQISRLTPQFERRFDPPGLGGTPPTRWDPPGNGVRPRQVFDPAGIN